MAAMPVTEMAGYEDDDTTLEFDVESDLPRFLKCRTAKKREERSDKQTVDDGHVSTQLCN